MKKKEIRKYLRRADDYMEEIENGVHRQYVVFPLIRSGILLSARGLPTSKYGTAYQGLSENNKEC